MIGDLTLTIIKPKAVENGHTGHILTKIEEAGFKILALKKLCLSKAMAEGFYQIHKERDFFDSLISFMTSGPVVVALLKKENAVQKYRKLIGETDPSKAGFGTIRQLYGTSKQANAVHGSDSDDNAIKESNFFFATIERLE